MSDGQNKGNTPEKEILKKVIKYAIILKNMFFNLSNKNLAYNKPHKFSF